MHFPGNTAPRARTREADVCRTVFYEEKWRLRCLGISWETGYTTSARGNATQGGTWR